jgi:rhodanese-related sulfurtransferase
MDLGAVVIDVMTPEDYAACHVAGAGNACIYEIVFLDRIAELVSGLNTELIIYDATGTTKTAEVARERLLQAGYTRVSILAGGLSAWRQAGLAVEGGAEPAFPESAAADGTYLFDVQKSRIEWIGRSLNNRHIGQLAITKGSLVIAAGRPRSADIIVDMHSLTNFDLQDAAYRDMLIAHLKSDDFLAVDRFPTASLTIRRWEAENEVFPIALGGIATGELTLRDIRLPVRFPALAAPQIDGSIKVHAAFDIDRTLWDISYGSYRYFERLGMHLVHDIISLELFVIATK